MNKQAWHLCFASLLFVFAGCAPQPQAIPTALPSAEVVQSSPTARPAQIEGTPPSNRTAIATYTVVEGDSISKIASVFKLQPETVLWANYELLLDDPDFLLPGMNLTILPVDGVYHQAGGRDSVQSLAAYFGADAQAIIDWPGNQIDVNNPQIFVGQWVLVPDGTRTLRRRFMPNLPSYAMAVDPLEYGAGGCPQNTSVEVTGTGNYVWPVVEPAIRGDSFWSAHPGLDVAITDGSEVLAADDGVVTFSGWSNLGYGYMIMLDHGNGDFSLYAGLGSPKVTCGTVVRQGNVIGAGGMTGHPAEPFVHFEIRRGEEFLDPSQVIQP